MYKAGVATALLLRRKENNSRYAGDGMIFASCSLHPV